MLSGVVREAARRFGERSALVAPSGWALTYEALDRAADEVAAGLRARGVAPGDLVALVLPPVPEHAVLYAALARLGAVTAAVNDRLTAQEREAVLASAAPDVVVAVDELAPAAGADLVVTPAERAEELLDDLRVRGGAVEEPPEDPERPVLVVFTSGTTGRPKGATFASRQLAAITSIDTGRRWADPAAQPAHALSATSLAHLGPMTKLPGNLHRGGTTHLLHRWSAGDALEATARHRMPVVAGIPTQLALMLRHPSFDGLDLSCVQAVVVGGGPATPALIREARERLGAPVAVRYSCTEAGIGVGTSFDDPPEDAEETVGRPHPGVDLTIRAERGDRLPVGEVGEVCLSSPAVMSGYHRDPDATAAAFWPDGAVRTGDLGFVDERGRLHLAGRSKEMYVRGGYNVYPMEVEAVLAAHPAVAEVAVVPRADEVMGEVGVAVLVPREGAPAPTIDDLRAFGADRLAAYKLPAEARVVDALPLTPMEKVDRAALRAQVGSVAP